MPQEADDAFDRLFHPVEIFKIRINLYRTILKDSSKPRVARCIKDGRHSDRRQHALRHVGVHAWIVTAAFEVLLQAHLDASARREAFLKRLEHINHKLPHRLRWVPQNNWPLSAKFLGR